LSKRNNIRWRDKDEKELQRIVKNYNAKIDRVKKREPEKSEFLPSKLSLKEERAKIKEGSRQDFNREKKQLAKANTENLSQVSTNQKGLTLTKFEIDKAREMTRVVNIKRTIDRKKLDASVEKGNLSQIANMNLKPKPFKIENKSKEDWEKFVSSLENEIASSFNDDGFRLYQENYIKALKHETKGMGIYADEIIDLISNFDSKTFFELANASDLNVGTIDFIYEPQEKETRLAYIVEHWESYLDSTD